MTQDPRTLPFDFAQHLLNAARSIVVADLNIQVLRRGTCVLLDSVLQSLLDKNMAVYKLDTNDAPSFHRTVEEFRSAFGFQLLHSYLMQRLHNEVAVERSFPVLKTMQHVLEALLDTSSVVATATSDASSIEIAFVYVVQEARVIDSLQISQALILHMKAMSVKALEQVPSDVLSATVESLHLLFEQMATTHQSECLEFHAFWRELILRMVASSSRSFKLAGWEQINKLIKYAALHRLPPQSILCAGAGADFCNGMYRFAGPITPECGSQPGTSAIYTRILSSPVTLNARTVTRLKLLRRTVPNENDWWWYISIADDEQPSDLDIYRCVCKDHDNECPPLRGWVICQADGVDPPPTITPLGVLVPKGEESHTLEYQLSFWILENEFLQQSFKDSTVERTGLDETGLVAFLSYACTRYRNIARLVALSLCDLFAQARATLGFSLCDSVWMEQSETSDIAERRFPSLQEIVLATLIVGPASSDGACTMGSEVGIALTIQDFQGMNVADKSHTALLHLSLLSAEVLAAVPAKLLTLTLNVIVDHVSDQRMDFHRSKCTEFHLFWRRVTFNLITSRSLLHKLVGWEQVKKMIKSATDHYPPPRLFMCTGAGTTFCNGEYHFAGSIAPCGYRQPGSEGRYVRHVVPSATSKTAPAQFEESSTTAMTGRADASTNRELTLNRCTVRNQKKVWFVSELDADEPCTDRDVDYYKKRYSEDENENPPTEGWSTCQPTGSDPPPTFTPIGVAFHKGQELQTLEHHLARWMIEEKIVERFIQDATRHGPARPLHVSFHS
jgi:hypothetical protein